jgi:hypothetical protein
VPGEKGTGPIGIALAWDATFALFKFTIVNWRK